MSVAVTRGGHSYPSERRSPECPPRCPAEAVVTARRQSSRAAAHAAGQQFVDGAGRVILHARKHIGEIFEGVDRALQLTRPSLTLTIRGCTLQRLADERIRSLSATEKGKVLELAVHAIEEAILKSFPGYSA